MRYSNIGVVITAVALSVFAVLLQSCDSSVGGNEDTSRPSVVLTSLNNAEEVIGDFVITWNTVEENRSTVDIQLSSDSGQTFKESDTVAFNAPDTGRFIWKTNDIGGLRDCRNCRIRITPTDIVGNVGESTVSEQDFIINNIPQVLGVAQYFDLDNNGQDGGDEIRVPFDKEIEVRTSIASDIFFFPVLGDSIGPFSTVRKGTNPKELIITMDNISTGFDFHLHIGKSFKADGLGRTAPSGINLQNNISEGVIFSPDTGRTATTSGEGADLVSTYTNSGQVLELRPANAVTIGDIDGDGDLDMVLGSEDGGHFPIANDIAINNAGAVPGGEGVFTPSTSFVFEQTGSAITEDITLGDIDGDGDLDLVVGNSSSSVSSGANQVYKNDGTGGFTNTNQLFADNTTFSVVLGDIDGDGDLDLVAGNAGANLLYINDGTGNYAVSSQQLGNSTTSSVVLGDIDGDDDLDLVAGNVGANLLYINDGTGNFAVSSQQLGSGALSVALGDIDGDDDIDLVAGNSNSGASLIYLNDGAGDFTASSQTLGSSGIGTISVTLGDIDNDGDLDLIMGNASALNLVYLNNSQGEFSVTSRLGNDNDLTRFVALGDIDGDGDLDLMEINHAVGKSKVYINSLRHPSATIFLDSSQVSEVKDTKSMALGDLDGDGDPDLIVGNRNGDFTQILINNVNNLSGQEGVFTDTGQETGIGDTQSVALGDIDGDGDLDLVLGNSEANRVYINDGAARFSISNQQLGNSNSVVLGDIDGDGDLDLVEANGFGAVNLIYINDGEGSFSVSSQPLSSSDAVVLGDIDGDGDLDLIGSGGLIYINDGAGFFVASSQQLGGGLPVLGDIDGDGDLDLVMGNDGPNLIYINDGSGRFAVSEQMLGTSETLSIALGDIDNDGDLDLVAGNRGGSNVGVDDKIYINSNGKGKFIDSGQVLSNSFTYSVILGDIDGDNDLDLILGSGRESINDFFANRGIRRQANKVLLNDY